MSHEQGYYPTEDEIRKQCLKIQEGWSEEERRKRHGIVKKIVGIPQYATPCSRLRIHFQPIGQG